MSDLLLIGSLLFFFLAFGVSRRPFDGNRSAEKPSKKVKGGKAYDKTEGNEEVNSRKRELRLAWLLAGVGGALFIASRWTS